MEIVKAKNLIFSYPDAQAHALNGIDFALNKGDFCLVCGKSGSGKSTLLRLLKKEIAPFGSLEGGLEISAAQIGFVNQNVENNIVTETVQGELAFPLQNTDMHNNQIALRIAETASRFDLNEYINEKTANLSGGVKQLLALASVMTVCPDLLVLDEPCSQLDPVSAQRFITTVERLNREEGVTVIISEHRAAELLPFANKILLLDEGRSSLFNSSQEFAEHLINTNNPMAEILPPYTRLLPVHPLSFAQAAENADTLKAQNAAPEVQQANPAITAKGLCFAYKKGGADVLFDLDYSAESGKINAVIGANSSGKTTLLKCLAGILKPYSGRVKTNFKTAYMPQNINTMFLKDSVSDEVTDSELLIKLGLENLSSRNPFDLSGGEAQRLAIAKALQSGADILLLDEPTKSVDAAFKAELAAILRDLCARGKTVILVTHDLEFAGRYADNCAFLFNGAIVAHGARREFFSALKIYTTALSRLTGGRLVSVDDAEGSV